MALFKKHDNSNSFLKLLRNLRNGVAKQHVQIIGPALDLVIEILERLRSVAMIAYISLLTFVALKAFTINRQLSK